MLKLKKDISPHQTQAILMAVQQSAGHLGLVPSEIENLVQELYNDLGEQVKDYRAVKSWLDHYERQCNFMPLTGITIQEARELLGLSRQEFALVCGFAKSKHMNKQISRLERGERNISPMLTRLVRLFVAGSRTPDWPESN